MPAVKTELDALIEEIKAAGSQLRGPDSFEHRTARHPTGSLPFSVVRSMASRATRFRRWLAQLLDYVLLHGPRLP